MEFDTGAAVFHITEQILRKLYQELSLQPSHAIMTTHTKERIPVPVEAMYQPRTKSHRNF